jgi:signal transduction histidine kinase
VDDDGRIYLGGVNGMVSFEPSDFNFLDEVNLPLRILSYSKTKIEGEEVVDNIIELSNQKMIHFYPEDKSIDFTFSMIDFNNNVQSKYAYKIEGYDKSWNLLEENYLKISRLPYGDYQLKVKGQNRYGKWSDQQISLPLIVKKPFYKKSWFYVLSILSMAGIIFCLFRYRLYRLEKEKLILELIVEERTKELEEQAQKLKRYNKIKDEFFAIIAHDLRGPIVSFQGISKKIKFLNKEGSQKDVDGMLDFVDSAAENINTLLDNLLNWALIQKGIFPYHPDHLKLKEVSHETVQLLNPMAQVKGVKIEQNISEQIVVKTDRNAMSMILRNVICNAIKFSSKGDIIKINATRKNGDVLLQIEDTGIGMSPDIMKKLYNLKGEKIRRGTSGEKGSGLGLVLCKELIEQNKGSIEVKSELKKGTTFSIHLPTN